MLDRARLIYWDANVFLAFLRGMPELRAWVDVLLFRAGIPRPSHLIFTSVVTITEVAFAEAERTGRVLDSRIEADIDTLWDRSSVRLAEFTEASARAARRLVRDSIVTGPRLRPIDAIHLATAAHLNVAEFHTFDSNLHKHSGRLGFPIVAPTPLDARRNDETVEQ